MVRPISKGRQKIAMEKIKDKTHLGVTFTKRRNGIFKKANELVALCGAQVVILLFSPGNKPYSFGHPNVNTILDRFAGENPQGGGVANEHRCYQKARIDGLNAQLKEIEMLVQRERNISKQLKEYHMQGNPIALKPRDELTYPQMLELRAMTKDLFLKISSEFDRRAGMQNARGVINNNPGLNYGPFNF